jgi:hypothetical protein
MPTFAGVSFKAHQNVLREVLHGKDLHPNRANGDQNDRFRCGSTFLRLIFQTTVGGNNETNDLSIAILH